MARIKFDCDTYNKHIEIMLDDDSKIHDMCAAFRAILTLQEYSTNNISEHLPFIDR